MSDTAPVPSRTTKLEGLQFLRALAALLVLWCHLKYYLGKSAADFPDVFLATNVGAIGVDIFFVISGFVISMTAAKVAYNPRAFLAARMARVVPLYFAVSTCALVEGLLVNYFSGIPPRFSGREVITTYAFIPFLDGPNFSGPILVNGWTLSFEMWFYLCFASLMKIGIGRRAWLWLPAFFVVGIAANLAWFGPFQWFLPKFLFHPITLEFCAGCFLYHLRNQIGNRGFYLMGALGLVFLFLGYDKSDWGVHFAILNDAKAGLYRTVVWGGFAACLVGVMTQIDLRYAWNWPRFCSLLGDASYSLYLVPAVFMKAFAIGLKLLGKIAGHELLPSPWWYGSIYVVGSVAVSIASWKFFELPVTRLAKRFLFRFVPNQAKAGPAARTIPLLKSKPVAN